MKSRSRKISKRYIGLVYIMPWILGFLIFQLYPLLASLYYSFTDFSILNNPNFVGLKNYIELFTEDKQFYNSLKVTAIYTLFSVPIRLIFALFIAMVLNMKLKHINLFRTIYYLPSILGGSVAISIIWRFLFMKEGVINKLLEMINLPSVGWLSNPDVSLITISLLVVWQFGSSMVLFLAGLKQIPHELYEAASVDGAGKIRTFFNVTLPLLTPIIFFNLVMQSINMLQDFTSAFVITNGGPMYSTYMIGLKIYDDAFEFLEMGYASALSWILFAMILLFTGILFGTSRKWVFYEDGGAR